MEQISSRPELYRIESRGSIYVGKLIVKKDETIELRDCVHFIIMPGVNQKGETVQIFIGNQIGTLIEYPDEVFMSILNSNSPFYTEYYKNVSGLEIVPSGGTGKNLKVA